MVVVDQVKKDALTKTAIEVKATKKDEKKSEK